MQAGSTANTAGFRVVVMHGAGLVSKLVTNIFGISQDMTQRLEKSRLFCRG